MGRDIEAWSELEAGVLLLTLARNYGDPRNTALADDIELREALVVQAAQKLVGHLYESVTAAPDEPEADWLDLLLEFHSIYGHQIAQKVQGVQDLPAETVELRSQLMISELKEYLEAAIVDDKVEMFDGLLDLLYVVIGSLITFFPADIVRQGFAEVHRSNMTKLGEDGKPIYDDTGKVVKGPNFELPRLAEILGLS